MTGSEGAPAPKPSNPKPMTVDKKPGKTIDLDTRLTHIEQKLDSVISSSAAFQIPDTRCLSTGSSDEIDLRELWNGVWQGKWIIFTATFAFSVVSILYAISLPNIYKSEALLAPAVERSNAGISGLGGQLGGLASLAGVNLGGGVGEKTMLALEILKSREFISEFIQNNDLFVPLMAAEKWESSTNRLVLDADIYDKVTKKWVRDTKLPISPEPSSQESYKRFMGLFNVSQDKTTNYVTVSVEFYSPYMAKSWVDMLIQEINQKIKEREVEEAKRSIKYLSEQLKKTALADMKTVFYQLIEEQMKTVMFAEVRDEYIFKTIDSSIVPELKTKPSRALIVILGMMLGGILSVIAVILVTFLRVKEI